MLSRCASFLKLNARASNSVKSWLWHFMDALLLRQLITAIVANNFPEFLRVEERHGFERHLSVRVVVEIAGRKQKVFLLAKLVEILRLPDPSLRCRRRFGSTLALLVQVRQRRQTPADRRKGEIGYSAASRKARNRRVPLQHSRLPRLDDCAE